MGQRIECDVCFKVLPIAAKTYVMQFPDGKEFQDLAAGRVRDVCEDCNQAFSEWLEGRRVRDAAELKR